MIKLKQLLREELLNPGNLPTPPSEITDILRMPKTGAFRNRIIVHLEVGTLEGWYDYNEGYHPGTGGEWGDLNYSDDKEEQENIIFDQDVIEGSENDKEAKVWKKWLIDMSKKPGYSYKVKEVYLGEV